MKQWQNFQALGKVKTCIEQQVREVATTLENSLDKDEVVLLSADENVLCVSSLGRITSVLHMMECHELALLTDEILGLVEDAAPGMEKTAQQIIEMRQLAFVALTDFPALLEGVLSGNIQHWRGVSYIFNRIRKARNRSLVFNSQTLLTKNSLNFSKVFADKPEHLKVLLDKQLKRYNSIKKQLHTNGNVLESVRKLHTVFFDLEVMSRDFRLATLWGLCATIAEVLPEAQANPENPTVKLLCSFSTIIQMVGEKGVKALHQNIPDDILDKLLEALTRLHVETESLYVIKCWFNLDLNLARTERQKNQTLLVGYNRKAAFGKAIRFLIERTAQLSEQINEAITNDQNTPQQAAIFTGELRAIQGSIAALGMTPLVAVLATCIESSLVAAGTDAVTDYLDRCAQTLYQCELSLQRRAEELERTVFVSRAGKHESTALTGVKLSVVVEAIKNLEQVVVAINDYAEANWDSGKLADVTGLLHSAGFALATVPLARAADFCAAGGNFVQAKLVSGAGSAQDQAVVKVTDAFAHLIISTILYLDQVSIGRLENCQRLERECNACLEALGFGVSPVASADLTKMAVSEVAEFAVDTRDVISVSVAGAPVHDAVVIAIEASDLASISVADLPAHDAGKFSVDAATSEDDEIRAIFVEEAQEVLLQIKDCHDALTREPGDTEALATLRRSFHTLKGSGRMVGAEAVGALAWSVENLLNNVISGRLQLGVAVLDGMKPVSNRLLELLEDFRASIPSACDVSSVAHDIAIIDAVLAHETPEVFEQTAVIIADAEQEVVQEAEYQVAQESLIELIPQVEIIAAAPEIFPAAGNNLAEISEAENIQVGAEKIAVEASQLAVAIEQAVEPAFATVLDAVAEIELSISVEVAEYAVAVTADIQDWRSPETAETSPLKLLTHDTLVMGVAHEAPAAEATPAVLDVTAEIEQYLAQETLVELRDRSATGEIAAEVVASVVDEHSWQNAEVQEKLPEECLPQGDAILQAEQAVALDYTLQVTPLVEEAGAVTEFLRTAITFDTRLIAHGIDALVTYDKTAVFEQTAAEVAEEVAEKIAPQLGQKAFVEASAEPEVPAEAEATTQAEVSESAAELPNTVDSLSEILEVEFGRNISTIRQYLDGSVSVDADGLAITSTSYLIPVHTLYGNCRVAKLQQFGAVAWQVERLLEDHPYRQVSAGLQALVRNFCDITVKVAEHPDLASGFSPSAELQHEFAVFLLVLDQVRREMSVTNLIEVSDKEEIVITRIESSESGVPDYDASLLGGFLHESRTTNAYIQTLYSVFRQDSTYSRDLGGRMRDQFNLFEEAATLADQNTIASVCRALASAYQQYLDGLYEISETLIVLLDRCHAYVSICMNNLEYGASVETPAEDLAAALQAVVEQLIVLQNEAQVEISEASAEVSLVAAVSAGTAEPMIEIVAEDPAETGSAVVVDGTEHEQVASADGQDSPSAETQDVLPQELLAHDIIALETARERALEVEREFADEVVPQVAQQSLGEFLDQAALPEQQTHAALSLAPKTDGAAANPATHAAMIAIVPELISACHERHSAVAEEQVEDSLLAVLIEEAGEILQELDGKIVDWQQAPADKNIIDDLLRLLHTLKGSAALVGEKEMSESAHRFESCVVDSGNARRNRDKPFFAEVDRHLNVLQSLYALYHTDESGRLVKTPMGEDELGRLMRVDNVQNIMDEVAAASQFTAIMEEEPQNQEALPQVATYPPAPSIAANHADNKVSVISKGLPAGADAQAAVAIDEHVRVSANLLKSLLNDADEISIARNRVEQTFADMQLLMSDMEETLGRIESSMNSFEFHAKTRAGIRQGEQGVAKAQGDSPEAAAARDFDALEMDKYTELQQIVLSLLEDYNDVMDIKSNVSGKIRSMGAILVEQQRSTNKLQEELVSSQMVPFAGIAPRLRRLVRQVSGELDKQVTISFGNPEGKVDRSVLQALVNPIEHMIRNALDHGIESAAERRASGKKAQGELLVKLYRQGASIILDIADDGRGINTKKVRQKAIAQGLLTEGGKITEQELCQFILRAGFSTSDTVSRISGRGVGLDVVQDEISQIGGDIEIVSVPGQGTTFRIRLPLTSSLNRALLFNVSGAEYVMLLNTIDGIILEKNATLQRSYGEDNPALFDYAGKTYELAYLGSLLDERAMPEFRGGKDASSSLVLVSGGGKNLALHVDTVSGSRELVVKSLGPQFSSLPVLTGGVILGDGRVVVVLDPRFLVDSQLAKTSVVAKQETTARNEVPTAEFGTGKTIMVVDDSITVRKVTSAILKRNGMNVILAKNGLEAVELLHTTRPDVMLLDIEMPKMDGFEVAAYVRRQDNGMKDLPIIMITSRIGDKHRSRAAEIGVNQYMCKPFQEVNLLEAIAGYN